MNDILVSWALESDRGQRLSTIKFELELQIRIVTDIANYLRFYILTETYNFDFPSLATTSKSICNTSVRWPS